MAWTTPTDRSTGYVVTAADWNVVEDDLAFLYGDTGWTAVTGLTNSWTTGTSAAFMLIGRVVYMRGALIPGTAGAAAFTLPVGYRPTVAAQFLVGTGSPNNTFNNVAISTAGVVTPNAAQNTWLSGISFSVV